MRLVQLELVAWEDILKEERDVSTDLLLSLGECPWYPPLLKLLTAAVPGFGDAAVSTMILLLNFPLFGNPSCDSNSFYLMLYNIFIFYSIDVFLK